MDIAFWKIHELISTTAPTTNDRIAKIEQKTEQHDTLLKEL